MENGGNFVIVQTIKNYNKLNGLAFCSTNNSVEQERPQNGIFFLQYMLLWVDGGGLSWDRFGLDWIAGTCAKSIYLTTQCV